MRGRDSSPKQTAGLRHHASKKGRLLWEKHNETLTHLFLTQLQLLLELSLLLAEPLNLLVEILDIPGRKVKEGRREDAVSGSAREVRTQQESGCRA